MAKLALALVAVLLHAAACSSEPASDGTSSLDDFETWLQSISGADWADRVSGYGLRDGVLSAQLNEDAAAEVHPGGKGRWETTFAYSACHGMSQYVYTTENDSTARAIRVSSPRGETLVTRRPGDNFCYVEDCEHSQDVGGTYVPPCREDG